MKETTRHMGGLLSVRVCTRVTSDERQVYTAMHVSIAVLLRTNTGADNAGLLYYVVQSKRKVRYEQFNTRYVWWVHRVAQSV